MQQISLNGSGLLSGSEGLVAILIILWTFGLLAEWAGRRLLTFELGHKDVRFALAQSKMVHRPGRIHNRLWECPAFVQYRICLPCQD